MAMYPNKISVGFAVRKVLTLKKVTTVSSLYWEKVLDRVGVCLYILVTFGAG